MARILITGSADGIGLRAAQRLISQGHKVVLHARSASRAADAAARAPGHESVLIGDLSSIDETKKVVAAANALGAFDAVILNAALYLGWERRAGKSGMPALFTVNTVAPYVFACCLEPTPKRILFVSSSMHRGGRPRLADLPNSNYSDSKLQAVMLAQAFARRWRGCQVNVADPGWVPTRMGGARAPDDIEDAVDEYVMLALGEGAAKGQTGMFWARSRVSEPVAAACDVATQERLLEELAKISGVPVPSASSEASP